MSRRGLLAVLVILSPLWLTGCPLLRLVQGVQQTGNARAAYSSQACFTYQRILTDAHAELRQKEPQKAARLVVGSREWERYLDKKRYLALPMFCPDANGDRVFTLADDRRTVICKLHGSWKQAAAERAAAAASPSGGLVVEGPTGKRPLAPGEDPTPWILHGLGFLFTLLAGWQYLSGGEAEDQVDAMRATPVRPSTEIADRGYFSVEGRTALTAGGEPLLAPRARTPVVFYLYRQLEEWEERHQKNVIWQQRVRVLKTESESVPFLVRDASGEVSVRAEGARLEGKRLAREQVAAGGSALPSGAGGMGLGVEYRNHRYVHEVLGLEVGEAVYVMGPTRGGEAGVCFTQDPQEERPFVVSGRPRGELLNMNRERSTISRMLFWTFGVVAALAFLGGFLVPPGFLQGG